MAASEKSGKGDSRRPFLKNVPHHQVGQGGQEKDHPPRKQASVMPPAILSPEAMKGPLTLLSQYSLF